MPWRRCADGLVREMRGLPGATCRLTGRNATGRAADSLLADPGTIARSTRPGSGAGARDGAGAGSVGWLWAVGTPRAAGDDVDSWLAGDGACLDGVPGLAPVAGPAALKPPEPLARWPSAALRAPRLPEAAPLGPVAPRSIPRPGTTGFAELAPAIPDRGAPVGGAMVRLAIPVVGASSATDRAVASPRFGCAPAAEPATVRSGCAAVATDGAGAADRAEPADRAGPADRAEPAGTPGAAVADQPGRTEAPARTAGRSCVER